MYRSFAENKNYKKLWQLLIQILFESICKSLKKNTPMKCTSAQLSFKISTNNKNKQAIYFSFSLLSSLSNEIVQNHIRNTFFAMNIVDLS